MMEQEDGINIIKSQYVMLNENLRKDLLTFVDDDGDENNDKIVISPLLKSLLIGQEQIHLWEEYFWILSHEELVKLTFIVLSR